MKFLPALLAILILSVSSDAAAADDRCYELRTYTSPEGKLDDLDRRFRKYSRRIFAKYDMDQVGFWVPLENPENQLIYILSYENCADRDPAWDSFRSDPEWIRIKEITEAGGDLVTNVESTMLEAADVSPTIGPSAVEHGRIFELRTYTAHPGKLDALLDRFRNHTMRLFKHHGMTNVAYWLPVDNEDNQLVYLLAHPSEFARNESWQDFIADPDWQAAYEASRADGPLVESIVSILLVPTDYSPLR